ncbi:MAG: SpoIID/LytB domain-containing protein, partial [Actinomycetota bacterium]
MLSGLLGGSAGAEEVAGPVRFVPTGPEGYVRVEGRFAPRPDACPANQPKDLHAAYPGILEVGRRADGRLFLVSELSLPEYLLGIDEVPRSWPMEALKAQVVAARTYALAHLNPSTSLARELRFNLCSTDACQVYRGRKVERGPWGAAWAEAVAATGGEILEYEGKPASTFYFSTSNGQTYSNAEVFGGSPLAYLKPVAERDDSSSPLSSWQVRMPLADLADALRRDGSWGSEEISSVVQDAGVVRLSGGGAGRSLSLKDLRGALNREAICLVPKRYPTSGTSGRSLPQVVPSRWMGVRQEEGVVVIAGRGWGHGVGMVQWGAFGKAQRGLTYQDILASYYGGLRPLRRAEPGTIRIGLAVDLEEVRVEAIGPVEVEGAAAAEGPLFLRGGSRISIGPGPSIAPLLKLRRVSPTGPAAPGRPAVFSFELSAPANVSLAYRGPGAVEGQTSEEPREQGAQHLVWDAASGSLPGGAYELTLVADDGVDRVASEALSLAVAGPPPSPSPIPSPSPSTPVSPTRSPTPGPEAPTPTRSLSMGALVGLTVVAGVAAA